MYGEALKYDDEGGSDVPAHCDGGHDPNGDDEARVAAAEEAMVKEEDSKLDACHGDLVNEFGSNFNLSGNIVVSIVVAYIAQDTIVDTRELIDTFAPYTTSAIPANSTCLPRPCATPYSKSTLSPTANTLS